MIWTLFHLFLLQLFFIMCLHLNMWPLIFCLGSPGPGLAGSVPPPGWGQSGEQFAGRLGMICGRSEGQFWGLAFFGLVWEMV